MDFFQVLQNSSRSKQLSHMFYLYYAMTILTVIKKLIKFNLTSIRKSMFKTNKGTAT